MNKLVAISIIIFVFSSCLKDTLNPFDKTIKQTFIIEFPTIKENIEIPSKINCYIFKDSVF